MYRKGKLLFQQLIILKSARNTVLISFMELFSQWTAPSPPPQFKYFDKESRTFMKV